MDFIDGKYEFLRRKMRVANGKVEKPGSQNGTFMLSNRDLGDGEVDFPHLMRALKRVPTKAGSWWTIITRRSARGRTFPAA